VGYRGNGPSFQNKMKDERQDYRYGPTQVHSIEEEDGAGSSQRQRNDSQWPAKPKQWGDGKKPWAGPKKPWKPDQNKLTFEAMLDAPCNWHSAQGGRPASHTNRQCSWMARIRKDSTLGLGLSSTSRCHHHQC
jgi:hypothetical protein